MKTLITLLAAALVFGFAYVCYLIARCPFDIDKKEREQEEPWEQR